MAQFRRPQYKNADPASVQDITEALAGGSAANQQAAASLLRKVIATWWITFSISSVCVVSGHLLIKAGLNASATSHVLRSTPAGRVLHIVTQPEVTIGLLIYMIGTACWMAAVSQKEISFLFPLSSVNYVLVVAASAVFFTENISTRRAAGVALIVVGMVLLNRKAREASA